MNWQGIGSQKLACEWARSLLVVENALFAHCSKNKSLAVNHFTRLIKKYLTRFGVYYIETRVLKNIL